MAYDKQSNPYCDRDGYKMSKYRYSIMAKTRILLGFFLTEIIFLAIGQIDYLKYVIWIPIIGVGYILFMHIVNRFIATFETDDTGLTFITNKNEAKVSWEDFEKIKIIKRRGKIVRFIVFHKVLKELAVLDSNIKNHKELFEAILTNVKKKNDKVVIVEKTEDLFRKRKT